MPFEKPKKLFLLEFLSLIVSFACFVDRIKFYDLRWSYTLCIMFIHCVPVPAFSAIERQTLNTAKNLVEYNCFNS